MMTNIELISYGGSYGRPDGWDLCISVSHFENPPKSCRDQMTGLSSRLQKEVYQHESFEGLYQPIFANIIKLIQKNVTQENLMIAVGCEMGKHRSVAIVEKIRNDLISQSICQRDQIEVIHRDLERKQRQIATQKEYAKRRDEKRGFETD